MNISRKIKDILHSKNLTVTQLNDLLNKKNGTNYTVQNLSRKLISDNLKFSDAEDILSVLDYTIEIVDISHLKEVAVTTVNYDEEHEEEEAETETERLSDLFQGSSKLDKAIDQWFDKYIEQRIEFKAKDYFDKVFISPPFSADEKPDLTLRKYYYKTPDKK